MLVIVPLWLGLLLWLIWYPQRRQNHYEAAKAAAAQHELATVAAMTEAMKEEYWRRKARGGEDLTRVPEPSKLPMLLWWVCVFGPLLWALWWLYGGLLGGGQ